MSQFVNPRRERFRGQDVLVFDFEPNPEYKPKNMEEKVVKELAGVVWIDEKAKDVVRLEAYFVGIYISAAACWPIYKRELALFLNKSM